MRLELKRIKLMSVQNGICTSEVFQIEISEGSVHRLGSCQNINLYPAGCLQEHEFLGVCMRLQILMITPSFQQMTIFLLFLLMSLEMLLLLDINSLPRDSQPHVMAAVKILICAML